MPIAKLYRNAILHRCVACGHQRRIGTDDLEIGLLPDASGEIEVDAESRAQPLISTPPCEECGSVELLSSNTPHPAHVCALWKLLDGNDLWECELDQDDLADDSSDTF